jgi:hypothetical protein
VVDLVKVAARLEAEEKFTVKYRFLVRPADGEVTHEVRQGKLLDVAEDAGLLYISYQGEVIWIKQEEVMELMPDA